MSRRWLLFGVWGVQSDEQGAGANSDDEPEERDDKDLDTSLKYLADRQVLPSELEDALLTKPFHEVCPLDLLARLLSLVLPL